MRQWRAAVAIFVLGALVGIAAIAGLRATKAPFPSQYAQQRSAFVVQLARQFGQADTLVLGDSLTEQTELMGACGRTFSAGVGGAVVEDFARIAPALIEATQPRIIVVALGTNDLVRSDDEERFRRAYSTLVSRLSGQLILVGIPEQAGDNAIRATATRLGARYVRPVEGLRQRDGVHFNDAGSRAFRYSIAAACSPAVSKTR